MFTAYLRLQEQGATRGETDSERAYREKYGNKPSRSAQPNPQYKIIAGDSIFVVTYIAASRGWCVYYKEPGAAKAQLRGQPMRSLKDAFASVAQML